MYSIKKVLRYRIIGSGFYKTASLTKLQQLMGHSSLQVSLTYLRGLEVKPLDIDDMLTLGR